MSKDKKKQDIKEKVVEDQNTEIDPVSQLQSEIEEQKNRYLRLMADFQNYQKRVEEEKSLFGAMANLSIVQDLLEVYDDLNLAIADESLDFDSAKSSIENAQNKLISAAEKAGIEHVEVKVGDNFNKEIMEAISTMPVEDDSQKGKVVAVINSAFKYKDKNGVIKTAKVIVGK